MPLGLFGFWVPSPQLISGIVVSSYLLPPFLGAFSGLLNNKSTQRFILSPLTFNMGLVKATFLALDLLSLRDRFPLYSSFLVTLFWCSNFYHIFDSNAFPFFDKPSSFSLVVRPTPNPTHPDPQHTPWDLQCPFPWLRKPYGYLLNL